jgi:hypothetical protein
MKKLLTIIALAISTITMMAQYVDLGLPSGTRWKATHEMGYYTYYEAKEYALKNLKVGNDLYNYSQAYKQYRYEKLSVVAPYILGVVLVGCIALLVRSFVKNANAAEKEGEV